MNENYKLINRLHLMRLTGNALDRACQHGVMAKEILSQSTDPMALKVLANKNQGLLERAIKSKLLHPIYESLILKYLKRNIPKDIQKIVEETIRAAGTNEKEAWLALYQPDMIMVLAALTTEKTRNLFLEGIPGCSSAIVTKTPGHEFYFSRNLDYPAASAWERYPTIFYHEPTDGGQKYVHAASLGIQTAGLTAVNESGIAFSLHAHFSKKISFKGTPIFFAGDQLLPRAGTLNEAIDILRNFKTIGNWAFNLASFNENKAVSVELSEGKTFVRDADPNGTFAHTNGFQTEELWGNQLHFTTGVSEDLYCRKSVMEAFLKERLPHYSLKDSMLALSSHKDYKTGKLRVYGNTVSVVTTIQSVIFEPHTQSMYVSSRSESPTALGPYTKLPFSWDKLTEEHIQQKPIPVEHNYGEAFLEAVHHFHLGYVTWIVKHLTAAETLPHLQACARLAPDDPHVLIQKGYFELMTGDAQSAKQSFANSLNYEMSPNLKHVATYFLGACADLLGNRTEALRLYRSVLDRTIGTGEQVDPKLKRRLEKRLKKAWKSSDCQKIMPDLQFVEPMEYP